MGDHLAVLLQNQAEFFDVVWAAHRIGVYVTPINWHLTADEAGYIVADCDAKALVASADLRDAVAAMGERPRRGRRSASRSTATCPASSGSKTSLASAGDGRAARPARGRLDALLVGHHRQAEGDPAPAAGRRPRRPVVRSPSSSAACSASPPTPCTSARRRSTTPVRRAGRPARSASAAPPWSWSASTPLELLAAIERHRVTHVQLVPTHMIRPAPSSPPRSARASTCRACRWSCTPSAPCPVEVKAQILDWLGPIVHEFYSGSEGAGFCYIGPEDWLAHPGSVGRSMMGAIHIVGEDGEELPVGEEGEVWFSTNRTFEYYGDPEKTKGACDPRGWSWLGDVGRVDEDGYLYLTDRASNMIISGGVNIYPREIEDVLVDAPGRRRRGGDRHRRPRHGREGHGLRASSSPAPTITGDELIAWSRERLSHFKCPQGGPLRRRPPPPAHRQAPQAAPPVVSTPGVDAGPRVAIVTGGSSGIGLEVGRQLVDAGYDVVLTARTADKLQAAAEDIGARWAAGDSADPDGVRRRGGGRRPGRPARARRRRHGRHVRAQGVARHLRVGPAHQPHLGLRRGPRRAPGHGAGRADRVPVLQLGARPAARQVRLLGVEGRPQRLRRGAGPGGAARRHRRPRRHHRPGGHARCSTTSTSRCARSSVDDVAGTVVWLDTLPPSVVLPEIEVSAVDTGPFAPEPFVPEAARSSSAAPSST